MGLIRIFDVFSLSISSSLTASSIFAPIPQLALQARCVDLENYPVLDPRQALQDLNASLLDTYEAERVVAEDTHEDDTQVCSFSLASSLSNVEDR